MEGHYFRISIYELDVITPESLKTTTPPFLIDFGVDILTAYEFNISKREEKIRQFLEIICRTDDQHIYDYMMMRNEKTVAKSEIREVIKKIIENEHAIRQKI